jgi:hypothetical protein
MCMLDTVLQLDHWFSCVVNYVLAAQCVCVGCTQIEGPWEVLNFRRQGPCTWCSGESTGVGGGRRELQPPGPPEALEITAQKDAAH